MGNLNRGICLMVKSMIDHVTRAIIRVIRSQHDWIVAGLVGVLLATAVAALVLLIQLMKG